MNIMNDLLHKYAPYIKKSNGIYKAVNNKLNYHHIELNNKLQIFFIHNKNTNISSATMCVNVGSIDNPPNIDGMAHYLEHMLFMGSDMFPGETYFQTQVANNGGSTNAFTTESMTEFFFTCNDNFIQLLQIFSKFFIEPSFDLKYVEKEVSAVDSEHKKNIGMDIWRIANLSKKFLTDSINGRFTTGTRETLTAFSGNNAQILRKALIDFYNDYYSSDKMILYICHNDATEDTFKIIKQMFESITLKKTKRTNNKASVRLLENMYEVIKVKTIVLNELSIKWLVNETESYQDNMAVDSFDILSHILGHEGYDSLFNLLFKSGFVIDMYAGVEHNFNENSIFGINMKLTTKGTEYWELILYIVNNYIVNLSNFNEKSQQMYDECVYEIEKLSVLNLKTDDIVNGLELSQYYANVFEKKKLDLKYIPIYYILTAPDNVRKKHFKNLLNELKFNQMKVIIGSTIFKDQEVTKIDKFYFTLYEHIDIQINNKLINNIASEYPTIYFPAMNKYLPYVENIRIIDPIQKGNDDYHNIYSKTGNIYYLKKGNTYETYNTCGMISIKFESMLNYNPINYIIIKMYILYIEKIRMSDFYLLLMTKTIINIAINTIHLSISVNGCSDSIDKIFSLVLDWYWNKKLDHKINENIYEIVYNDLMSNLVNYHFSEPYEMVIPEFKKSVNEQHIFSNEQLIDSLKKIDPVRMSNVNNQISFDNFRSHSIDLMSKGNIIGIFGGSFTVSQTNNVISILDNYINKPKNYEYNLIKYSLRADTFSKNTVIYNKNPYNTENAIGYGLYVGNLQENKNTKWTIFKPFCMLLDTYISEKFSSLVRTEQEVGYIAITNIINVNESNNPDIFLLFIVQSSRTDLIDVVQNYVDNHLLSDIESITNEDFLNMIQSLCTKLTEKPININNDVDDKFIELLSKFPQNNKKFHFNRKRLMLNSLKNVKNKDEFVEFVKNIISNNIRSVILIESPKKSSFI